MSSILFEKRITGKPVTFGNAKTELPWKNLIKEQIGAWDSESIRKTSIVLDFFLDSSRFTNKGKITKNDLDNLAKPVLDALVESKILFSDSEVLDLVLRKRIDSNEGVRIRIYEWNEENFKF